MQHNSEARAIKRAIEHGAHAVSIRLFGTEVMPRLRGFEPF